MIYNYLLAFSTHRCSNKKKQLWGNNHNPEKKKFPVMLFSFNETNL
jgi:hypothetical protein